MRQLLIVDDEPAICASLLFALEDEFRVFEAYTADDALDAIRQKEIEIVLLDLKLGNSDGLQVLQQIKAEKQGIVIIMMTAFGSIHSSVAAMKTGAFYYITKPIDMDELRMLLAKAVEYLSLESRVQYLNNKLTEVYEVEGIIGKSATMRQVTAQIDKLRNVDANVLITGESGTGKELVAMALHYGGNRRNEPFEVVNCAAIPLDLLESELFGHEKGAFTGATQRRKGLFELADRGTIFLDEISELDQRLQAKLLRVVQEKEIMPVGSGQRKKIDVRIICATNRDLRQLVAAGKIREDLFFRLNVVNINLPALRERPPAERPRPGVRAQRPPEAAAFSSWSAAYSPSGKSVEAASSLCSSKSARRALRVEIVQSSACEPSIIRRGAGSLSALSMMRAAMRTGSPGARPFAASSILRKAWAGLPSYSAIIFAAFALP